VAHVLNGMRHVRVVSALSWLPASWRLAASRSWRAATTGEPHDPLPAAVRPHGCLVWWKGFDEDLWDGPPRV